MGNYPESRCLLSSSSTQSETWAEYSEDGGATWKICSIYGNQPSDEKKVYEALARLVT